MGKPSQHAVSGHHRPSSETPFKKRFAGGPIVARFSMFTGNRLSSKTFNEKPLFGFSKTTLIIDLGDNRYDIYSELSANDSYGILCLIFLK